MSNYALSRLERIYLQNQTAFGVIPNSAGTATVANSNCCRHIKAMMDSSAGLLIRRDKTGSRTATQGILGRKNAKWSLEMSLAPNGTAGVIPDCDPVFQSMFGQAATVTSGTVAISGATNVSPIVVTATGHGLPIGGRAAGTITGVLGNTAANGTWVFNVIDANTLGLIGSAGNGAYTSGGSLSKATVQYTFVDTPLPTFAMYSFRQPSTESQRVAFGCVVSDANFTLGQDVATWTTSGECLWSAESSSFAGYDSIQKGGLTAFPSEPSTPVTNGGIIAGFTGRVVINGTSMVTIRTASIRYNTGAQSIKDLFGSYYPDSVEADERNVEVSFSLYEDDSTSIANLIALGESRTPVDIVLQVGTNPGSIAILYLKSVQMPPVNRDEQRRFILNVADSRAFGSSVTARDELTLWFL